jgi:hypothetical protein
MEKAPVSLVFALDVAFVAGLMTVTLAQATAAPELSVTVPVMEPA